MSASARDLPTSFEEALHAARKILLSNHEHAMRGSVDAEAERIVMGAFRQATGQELTRMELFSRMRDRLPEKAGEKTLSIALARAEGKVLQHLLGTQAFLGHEYEVGPETLVPRPETEILVTEAAQALQQLDEPPSFGIEIGLGSGVISIELLSAFPELHMLATELKAAAEARAMSNAARILGDRGATRLRVLRPSKPEDVLQPFQRALGERRADFLISNPPYLAPTDPIEKEVLDQEPREALFPANGDPMHFYREIAKGALKLLAPWGQLFLELAHERAVAAAELFVDEGFTVRLAQDLNQRDRVLVARRLSSAGGNDPGGDDNG